RRALAAPLPGPPGRCPARGTVAGGFPAPPLRRRRRAVPRSRRRTEGGSPRRTDRKRRAARPTTSTAPLATARALPGFAARTRASLPFDQLFHFAEQGGDVTELAVHGSKAHVRHLVHGAQSLHDRFAYGAAGDFGFAVLPEGPLDVVDDILQHSQRNGPLFARGDQAGQQFLALKRLPPPVLFYDKKGRL